MLLDELTTTHNLMKPYQQDAVNWLTKNKVGLLEADTGAGKTLMLLTAIAQEIQKNPLKMQHILIICSKNAINTWLKEIEKWYPSLFNIFDTLNLSTLARLKRKQAIFLQNKPAIIICTYGTLRADEAELLSKQYRAVLMDEAHRGGIRNHKAKTFAIFKKLRKCTKIYLWTSATVIDDSAMDLFASCNLADSRRFRGYWPFAYKYCHVVEGPFGKEILQLKNNDMLYTDTCDIIYKIPSILIDAQKPKLTRSCLYTQLSTQARKAYDDILNDLMYMNPSEDILILLQNNVSANMKLRQLLCSPMLIDPQLGIGNTPELIYDKLEDIQDQHCMIFVPFRKAADIYANFFKEKYPNLYIDIICGGSTPTEMHTILTRVKESRGILICTIQFAESYECETAKNLFFAGFDYEVNAHIQAEGRLHRMITKHPINAYYIINEYTLDVQLFDKLQQKYTAKKKIVEKIQKTC